MRFYTREAQISWIKLSLSVLTLAVDSIKVTTQYPSLVKKAFDLFKCTVYLVGHFNLSGYEEHFASENVKGENLLEIAENTEKQQCLITETFQIVMKYITLTSYRLLRLARVNTNRTWMKLSACLKKCWAK